MSAQAELAGLGGHGLGGHGAEHQQLLLYLAVGVFLMIVLALVFFYRRSRESLEMEEIDELLRKENIF